MKTEIHKFIEEKQHEVKIIKPLQKEDHFRASSIYKLCPREEAIYHKHNIERKENISPGLFRTFRFGRMFERFFRDEVIARTGILLGQWKCKLCKFQTAPRIPFPQTCEICGGDSFEYEEEEIIDHELGTGGHPDGFILWENKLHLLELKTANTFNFSKVLLMPFEQHKCQMQIYMHLLKLDKGLCWYFNKDTSQDIVHEVIYDRIYVENILKKPAQYKEYLRTGELPPRYICQDPTSARANKCKACKYCFAN